MPIAVHVAEAAVTGGGASGHGVGAAGTAVA